MKVDRNVAKQTMKLSLGHLDIEMSDAIAQGLKRKLLALYGLDIASDELKGVTLKIGYVEEGE